MSGARSHASASTENLGSTQVQYIDKYVVAFVVMRDRLAQFINGVVDMPVINRDGNLTQKDYAENCGDTQVQFLDEVVDAPVVVYPTSLLSLFREAQAGVNSTEAWSACRDCRPGSGA